MKWMIVILLFITAAGTLIPCCLLEDNCDEQVAASSHQEDQRPKSACSPFSACASCPGFVALLKYIHVLKPVTERQVHDDRLHLYHLPVYISSCWQPPRSC